MLECQHHTGLDEHQIANLDDDPPAKERLQQMLARMGRGPISNVDLTSFITHATDLLVPGSIAGELKTANSAGGHAQMVASMARQGARMSTGARVEQDNAPKITARLLAADSRVSRTRFPARPQANGEPQGPKERTIAAQLEGPQQVLGVGPYGDFGPNWYGLAKTCAVSATQRMLPLCSPLVDRSALLVTMRRRVVSQMVMTVLVAAGRTSLAVLGKLGVPRWAGHLAYWEKHQNQQHAQAELAHEHALFNGGFRVPHHCVP